MKIDRLMGITMYLLNREKATAKELAEKFEVSIRTISRDIDTLGMAGIPVVSDTGMKGGYRIMDTYGINKGLTTEEDYSNILCSLEGLCSAYKNKNIEGTLERLKASWPAQKEPGLFLDFSVCREGRNTDEFIRILEQAVASRKAVQFYYTGADQNGRLREAEPLALSYRWYAWYLFAYCKFRRDYRIFKLNRMEHLIVLDTEFEHVHSDIGSLLEKHWADDKRPFCTVKLKCRKEVRAVVCEYLNGTILKECEDGDFLFSFQAPEQERLWFSLLLSLGGSVTVLEPVKLRERLLEKAGEIIRLYENQDIKLS